MLAWSFSRVVDRFSLSFLLLPSLTTPPTYYLTFSGERGRKGFVEAIGSLEIISGSLL